MELQVLRHYLPDNTFRFFDMGTSSPYLLMGMITNSGNPYTIRINLENFPENIPEVYVTRMLRTSSGSSMDSCSASMHTLSSRYGFTRICHYGSGSWKPNVSLYKVFVKCRLWIEMYELHLKTGKTIDYYLNHQS